MQEIIPAVSDLGVDRPRAIALAGALRYGKGGFKVSVETLRLDPFAGRECRQVLEAEIYADGTLTKRLRYALHFHHNVQVPAPAAVFGKAARAQRELPEAIAVPETEESPVKSYLTSLVGEGARLERNPAQRAARSAALAPAEADLLMLFSPGRILFGDLLKAHRRNGQTCLRCTVEIGLQLEPREESALPVLDLEAQFVAVVPDEIHLSRPDSQFMHVLVLDPQAEDAFGGVSFGKH